ncbi:putative bifunctional diguanylate cyclase/phosphodiesterase [Parerythrobacter aestuarii]|uniref:putative bifunctional diguanylate cyclase/phosphodiesterase n=1 Tax=Parerythrobacter aestuarii TaxID=3020909 RepID=UPI0024DE8B0B|nr:bifunctional diguanylate cyclase/phosphodiesterase [Parerythrobacter aestuarii]
MFEGIHPENWSTKQLVFVPIVVLSLIFALTVGAMVVFDGLDFLPWQLLAGIGLVAYACVIWGLVRFGIAGVDKIEVLAKVDTLTGMPNRRALHADIAREARDNEDVAVALVDLDGFKQVNDHYGHAIGDMLIKQAGAMIAQTCGKDARAYRLGGDEFAIVVIGTIAGNVLEGLSRTLVEQFRSPMAIDDRRIAIGASVGLARSNGRDGISSSELLRRADVAMFASKRGGKMRCTWYSEEFDRNREARRDLDNELRAALANEEFRLNYQPLVDANSGQIVAVESLIRWDRPDGKPIGPNIFIPVAEESGLINAIGLWVLRRACTDARGWDDLKLSVNISAAQLRNPEFPIHVGQVLEETGFPAERLELEVTETCLVLDPVVVGRSLDLIRQFGVSISLDDFGTGYASIGFLRQFRFEKLKLDRSLVVDAQGDDNSRAMMISSISLARAMAMGVTAEGVETEAQADLVRAAGADQIQGWLYYRAMPPEQIDRLRHEFGDQKRAVTGA